MAWLPPPSKSEMSPNSNGAAAVVSDRSSVRIPSARPHNQWGMMTRRAASSGGFEPPLRPICPVAAMNGRHEPSSAGSAAKAATHPRYPLQLVILVLVLFTALVADAYGHLRPAGRLGGIQGVTYIDGGATLDPRCPPPPGRKNCVSFPYRARILVRLADAHRTVAVIHSNSKGRFRVRLRPGWYVLMPRTTIDSVGLKIVPRRAQIRVRVRRSGYATIKIDYFSFPPCMCPGRVVAIGSR